MSVAQACVLSLFAFTGASQFALTGAVATGGGLIGGAAGAIPLGSRNALYGLRLAEGLQPPGAPTLVTAPGGIDETTPATPPPPAAPPAPRPRRRRRAGLPRPLRRHLRHLDPPPAAGRGGGGAAGPPAVAGHRRGGAGRVPGADLPPAAGRGGRARGGAGRRGDRPGRHAV